MACILAKRGRGNNTLPKATHLATVIHMLGIIDTGGGMRAIFQSGVFDWALEHHLRFERAYGVSAGTANIASFLAGQKGRNIPFYTVYNQRWRYVSLRNLLLKGSTLDLHYVYGTISNHDGENPLDYPALMKSPTTFTMVATNAKTAQAHYFTKDDLSQDHYEPFGASSCLPVVCRPFPVKGVPYFDGGVVDPIPVQKALDDGCDKLVLVISRPKDEIRQIGTDGRYAGILRLQGYPKVADALLRRSETYNRSLALARKLETEGKALIIAPDDISGIKTMEKDKKRLMALYDEGRRKAQALLSFLEK